MFYIVLTSLSLFAIGIFFIPLKFLLMILPVFLVLIIISRPKEIAGFFKSFGLLILMIIPLFVIRLITHRQGEVLEWWKITIYSEGLELAVAGSVRIALLFSVSYLILKIWFPLQKYREQYAKMKLLRVVIQAVDLFPVLMRVLGETFKTIFTSGRKNPQKLEKLLRLIDRIYVNEQESSTAKENSEFQRIDDVQL